MYQEESGNPVSHTIAFFSGFFTSLLSYWLRAGLPDGTFSYQKNTIWVNFWGLWNGKYFMGIRNILRTFLYPWLFANLVNICYIFSSFWFYCVKKDLATLTPNLKCFRRLRSFFAAASEAVVTVKINHSCMFFTWLSLSILFTLVLLSVRLWCSWHFFSAVRSRAGSGPVPRPTWGVRLLLNKQIAWAWSCMSFGLG
jgi:hypothetical protein